MLGLTEVVIKCQRDVLDFPRTSKSMSVEKVSQQVRICGNQDRYDKYEVNFTES